MTGTKEQEAMGSYLGRRVYVEAFGRKRFGVVCSVHREKEKLVCEVEWADGQMDSRPFPQLRFADEEKSG